MFYQKHLQTQRHHHSQLPAHNMDLTIEKPLCLTCSGGGGHRSAMNGLIEQLLLNKNSNNVIIKRYKTGMQKPSSSLYALMLHLIIWALSNDFLNKMLHNILIKLSIEGLPPYVDFKQELDRLYESEKDSQIQSRPYIDLLLDLYPAGYEFVAIFNTLQRGDYLKNLNTIVNAQPRSDKMNYRVIYRKILKILSEEAKNGQPFTEIISTQPQSLAAICDAVEKYNQTHQPIIGAKNFSLALDNLTKEQKHNMQIYAVCENLKDLKKYLQNYQDYNSINMFSVHENPMVRHAFKNPELANLYSEQQDCFIKIHTPHGMQEIKIAKNTKIASIMLGSLAGNASLEYAKYLLSTEQYAQIFIFRADNTTLNHELLELSKTIICLDHQTASTLAAIMVRSNCVILRGGGLSLMENMALPIIKNKIFLFHHPAQGNENKDSDSLSTGLSWEDTNINAMIKHIRKHGAFAYKVTPLIR